jgi:hypothetical protein
MRIIIARLSDPTRTRSISSLSSSNFPNTLAIVIALPISIVRQVRPHLLLHRHHPALLPPLEVNPPIQLSSRLCTSSSRIRLVIF